MKHSRRRRNRWIHRTLGTLACVAALTEPARAQVRDSSAGIARPHLARVRYAEQPIPDLPHNEPESKPTTSGHRGQLKNDPRNYTGRALLRLLDGRGWSGWERQRTCIAPAPEDTHCRNGALDGRMLIQAIGDAQAVPATGGGRGIVVGRIKNIGDYDDATTQVAGGEAYPAEYYFITVPKGGSTGQLLVAEVRFNQETGDTLNYVHVFTAAHDYTPCADVPGHPPHHIRRAFARGDFRTCDMDSPPDQPPTAGEQGEPASGARAVSDATSWFSCSDGCCTAQWPPSALTYLSKRRAERTMLR